MYTLVKDKIDGRAFIYTFYILYVSVPDPDPNPDPLDPHVFGPPGSGSGSFYHQAKIVRKTLILTVL
jgi:hypothetical protein